MALLKVKLDVYPLENYVQSPVGSSADNARNPNGGSPSGAGVKQRAHNAGAANGKEGESKRHKTALEKLMTLKLRCLEEQCVQSAEAVLIAHVHRHPHIILLKQPLQPNQPGKPVAGGSGAGAAPGAAPPRVLAGHAGGAAEYVYRLPGGRCRRGETEEGCLHRKLGRQLLNEPKLPAGATLGSSGGGGGSVGVSVGGGGASDTVVDVGSAGAHTSQAANYFRIGEVLAKWYRPHFSQLMYPYVPPHLSASSVKEVRSIFLVHLEPMVYFNLYREDTELVAVPLFDLYENTAKYGPIIASLPVLLSRVLINYCSTEY